MKLEKTITSMFLVPALGLDKETLHKYNYLNSYSEMVDKDKEYDPHVVYILFRPTSKELFQDFIEKQYDLEKGLLEDYNLDDEFVVLVFQLDDKFKKDYELVKISKYSKTSKDFQKLFPALVVKKNQKGIITQRPSLQKLVFTKDPSLHNYWEQKIGGKLPEDAEVWYDFNIEKETLDFESIIKQLKDE